MLWESESEPLRSRELVFLEAKVAMLEKVNKQLTEDLEFERKVNDRVNEIFKGWFHRNG